MSGPKRGAWNLLSNVQSVSDKVLEFNNAGILGMKMKDSDLDRAFACLMRQAETGAWWVGIKYLDYYSPLRQDPRYLEFCRKVGILP